MKWNIWSWSRLVFSWEECESALSCSFLTQVLIAWFYYLLLKSPHLISMQTPSHQSPWAQAAGTKCLDPAHVRSWAPDMALCCGAGPDGDRALLGGRACLKALVNGGWLQVWHSIRVWAKKNSSNPQDSTLENHKTDYVLSPLSSLDLFFAKSSNSKVLGQFIDGVNFPWFLNAQP